jgi:DNA polymerase III subunit gamma/tau
MSYQVIARKWRPQTFEEVTGQEAITHTLRNGIEFSRLHHAYLFSGARGVGKTTTARLLAKALNCHSSDKPVVQPCNNCPSCQEIAEGRSIDVLEFDAASNTQVDKIRDLIIENINISAARDRYKVFIIDEVHMLSTSSFNALLKTLEEPPPNIVFIMATTELHKVPVTILSRCQEFEFRTIATAKIFERLNLIADAEGITISAEALREIARSGEGSMRDAQSNFDQVISFTDGSIEIKDVINALGIASSEILTRTIEAIAHRKPEEALLIVDELIQRGQDLRNFCRDVLSFLRDLLVAKVSTHSENLLDTAILDAEALRKYAEHFSESDLVRLFNSLSETETKLRNANQPRFYLEIGLVKLMEMKRVSAIEQILERLAKLENFSPTEEKKTLKVSSQWSVVSGQKSEILASKPNVSLDEVPFPIKNEQVKVEQTKVEDIPFPTENVAEIKVEEIQVEKVEKIVENEQSEIQNPKSKIEEEPFFAEDSRNAAYQIPNLDFTKISRLMYETDLDLSHYEDTKLDSAFEEHLSREGDELKTIKNASQLISDFLVIKTTTSANSNNGTAVAPAKSKPSFKIDIPKYDYNADEIPVLPANPTEEDLLKYAENHPKVKLVSQIFRAKIIKVEKNGTK